MRSREDEGSRGSLIDTEVEIRRIELGDLASVYELGERLFRPEKWPALYRTWDSYEVVSYFVSDTDTCFVATLGGKVIGFVLGTTIEKKRSSWIYGYIVWLGVDDRVGRRGVGGMLFKAVKSKFRSLGARMLLVDTDARNVAALSFFKKAGFDHEQKHVYLSLNLSQRRKVKGVKKIKSRRGFWGKKSDLGWKVLGGENSE